MSYTISALISAIVTLLLDLVILRTRVVMTRHFARFIGFMSIGFMICNGVLTAVPVVTYNSSDMLGFRFFTIPVEDFVYGFSLVTSTISIYEFLNKKEKA
ncbi:MAG: lycopene cyclase domain-containing protein [Candidatus Kryptoniota bacterium]